MNKKLKIQINFFSTFLLILFSFSFAHAENLAIGTWNVRQLSYNKIDRPVKIASEQKTIPIKKLMSHWIQDQRIDVLALQEVYEEYVIKSDKYFHPVDKLMQNLPSKYKVIKGQSVRASIKKGEVKIWREFCPIIYNSNKITCHASKDSMVPTGIHDIGRGVRSTRKGHWAYCQTRDKSFDFVFTCLHTNYAHAKEDLEGLKTVIQSVVHQSIDLPKELSLRNTDYIFAGDYNLDRKTARAYGRWKTKVDDVDYVFDDIVPDFSKGSLWTGASFTKLKNIHTFKELSRRSEDIYDDVVNTPSVLESLKAKSIDGLVGRYFVDKKGNVDVPALLSVSDHLPVIADYDTTTDTD